MSVLSDGDIQKHRYIVISITGIETEVVALRIYKYNVFVFPCYGHAYFCILIDIQLVKFRVHYFMQ